MMTRRTAVRLAAVLALLAACGITDPEEGEQPGIIQMLPEVPAQVTVPAVARRGEPFTVTVVTHGGGCLSKGPTRVRTRGMTAEVRPMDVHTGTSECPPNVAQYGHTAILRFDQPGTATVEFKGTGYPGREPITITRTVTIQ